MPPEVPPSGQPRCRPSFGDGGQPAGLREWATDRCVNIILGEFILRSEHAPLFDNGLIPELLEVGYTYPVSVDLVRVSYYRDPVPVVIPPEIDPEDLEKVYESCRLHVGRDVIFNGYEHVVTCGQRGPTEPVQATIMKASFIWKSVIDPIDLRLLDLLEAGYEYEIGAYPTPVAIEVHIGAGVSVCGILT